MRARWLIHWGVGLLVAAAVATIPAEALAAVTQIQRTPIEGAVSQVVYDASGKPDGIVLQDHTLLEFPPQSLSPPNTLSPGDRVSASGIQVLSAPNRVFDRISLQRGGTTLFDNSHMSSPPAAVIGQSTTVPFKSMTDSSPLLAAGANAGGDVDRLILQDGTNVQIPRGAYVNPTRLHLGQPIAVAGAGAKFPVGSFLHAMTAQVVGGRWLLQARGLDGEQWMLKQGMIKQALVTPRGQVDGVLLTDNTAIRFMPIPQTRGSKLVVGTRVKAAGPGVRNQMGTDALVLTDSDTFMPLVSTLTEMGLARQLAGQVPPPELMPLKDTAKIGSIFRNSRNQIETLVLSDGTRVWVPPRLRRSLPRNLRMGDTVSVAGRGGTYALGTSLEADRIQRARPGAGPTGTV